ncbi:MAG: hypothetical protein NT154_35320 [Verrucomicrobia bacterium]|nr:hypothetical protein [Verrucomicrobiota bacterium]
MQLHECCWSDHARSLITVHPQSAIVVPGTAVIMSVAATGTLSYRSQMNDTNNLTG